MYDERDRQIQVKQVLNETLRYSSRMAYDPLGNLVASTDAKGRSSRRFSDALNRFIQERDPQHLSLSFTQKRSFSSFLPTL